MRKSFPGARGASARGQWRCECCGTVSRSMLVDKLQLVPWSLMTIIVSLLRRIASARYLQSIRLRGPHIEGKLTWDEGDEGQANKRREQRALIYHVHVVAKPHRRHRCGGLRWTSIGRAMTIVDKSWTSLTTSGQSPVSCFHRLHLYESVARSVSILARPNGAIY